MRCAAEASFYLQQALEKILKYQLYKSGCKPPIKTHNLQQLLNMLQTRNIVVPVPIVTIAPNATNWETYGKYTDDEPPTIDDLVYAYNLIKSYCDTVIGCDIFTI